MFHRDIGGLEEYIPSKVKLRDGLRKSGIIMILLEIYGELELRGVGLTTYSVGR